MTKLVFRRSIKRFAFPFLITITFIVFGYVGFKYALSQITKVETISSVGEIADIILSFISLFVTIILGVIVYQQSDRINSLESTQYSVFLGVDQLDLSLPMGTEFFLLSKKNDRQSIIKPFQIVDSDDLGLQVNISLSEGSDLLDLPFRLITRNAPLITSIDLERIDWRIRYVRDSNRCDYMDGYPVDSMPINRFIEDRSRLTLRVLLNGVPTSQIRRVFLTFKFRLHDQYGREHVNENTMVVEQRYGTFCLLSSQSSSVTD